MDFTPFFDWFGEPGAVAVGGLLAGSVYGVAAQRSRFCLRAAAVEFGRGAIGPRTSVWLLCFGAALFWTQLLITLDVIDVTEARWVASASSLSGAAIGGLIFGAGMVLARGCPGRLLVLAASGNLRALLAGLVFAVAAQASLHGALSPLRDALAGLWTTGGPNPNVLETAGFGSGPGFALGLAAAIAAVFFALCAKVSIATLVFGSGVGVAVALGWWFTATLSAQTFDPTPIESLTFSGPTADVLMTVLQTPFNARFGEAMDGIRGNVLVLPVKLGDRVPVLVFASGTPHPVDPRSLNQLVDGVAAALERLILRRKSRDNLTPIG